MKGAAAADNDLSGMTGPSEIAPQRDELRMPHGKNELVAACRRRAGENRVDVDTGEALVNQVLVRLSTTERGWVVCPGIALL